MGYKCHCCVGYRIRDPWPIILSKVAWDYDGIKSAPMRLVTIDNALACYHATSNHHPSPRRLPYNVVFDIFEPRHCTFQLDLILHSVFADLHRKRYDAQTRAFLHLQQCESILFRGADRGRVIYLHEDVTWMMAAIPSSLPGSQKYNRKKTVVLAIMAIPWIQTFRRNPPRPSLGAKPWHLNWIFGLIDNVNEGEHSSWPTGSTLWSKSRRFDTFCFWCWPWYYKAGFSPAVDDAGYEYDADNRNVILRGSRCLLGV